MRLEGHRSTGRKPIAVLVLALTVGLGAASAAAATPPRSSRPPSRRSPAQRIENRNISVLGLKMHYLESGEGPTVVLLHGLGGAAGSWRETMATLAQKRRVIAPDLIGFGASEKPAVDYSTTTLADFLDRFLSALALERVSVAGHATGARVACLLALAHPSRVDRLVLVSGSGHKPNMDDELQRAINFNTLSQARRLLELLHFDDSTHVTDAAAEEMFSRRLRSGTGYTISRIQESYRRTEGYADDLSPIKAPTLIVWGRDDELSPVAGAEKAHRQIKGSTVVVLERCGHLPMVEAPEMLTRLLADFLPAR